MTEQRREYVDAKDMAETYIQRHTAADPQNTMDVLCGIMDAAISKYFNTFGAKAFAEAMYRLADEAAAK
jgi:hypothetical protein